MLLLFILLVLLCIDVNYNTDNYTIRISLTGKQGRERMSSYLLMPPVYCRIKSYLEQRGELNNKSQIIFDPV